MKKRFKRHQPRNDIEIEYLPITEPSAIEQAVIWTLAWIILPALSDIEASANLPVIA